MNDQKQTRRKVRTRLGLVAVLVVAWSLPAFAVDLPRRVHEPRQEKRQTADLESHPWSLGLRLGPAIPTQDVSFATGGAVVLSLSPRVQYDINQNVSIGFDFTYERHVPDDNTDSGKLHTMTLLPYALYRFDTGTPFSPYFNLGVGFNVNSYSNSDTDTKLGFLVNPSNTLAVKAGAGVEYLFQSGFALNFGVGWKWNKGTFNTNIVGFRSVDFNVSAVHLLFGAAYYF